MEIVRHNRLAPTFSVYKEAYADGAGRKLRRIVFRWNGRFYVSQRN